MTTPLPLSENVASSQTGHMQTHNDLAHYINQGFAASVTPGPPGPAGPVGPQGGGGDAIDPMEAPYNAAGDGSDDSAELQAAFAAAAVTGSVVRPRAGHTFGVAATVNLAGCTLDGNGCVFKGKAGLTGNLLLVGSNATVKNCKVDGSGMSVTGIHATTGGVMSNVRILDNEVTGCGLPAVRVDTATSNSDIRVRGNYVHDTTVDGIWVLGGPQYRVDVSNNIVRNTGGTSLHVSGSTAVNAVFGLTVNGNLFDAPGEIPLEVFWADGFTVTGNILRAGTLGFGLAHGLHGTISGNTFQNQSYGIEVNDGNDTVAIAGNTFDQCTIGIFLDGSGFASSNVTISGNTIARGQQAIMFAVGCVMNRVLISGNTLVDPTTRGIQVDATVNDLVVTGNAYVVTAAPVLAGNACFVMFNGVTTRAAVTGNVLSVAKTGVEGNGVGAVRILAALTNSVVSDNMFLGTGSLLAQSAISTAAVSCPGLRIERNRVVNYSDGVRTTLATNNDITVVDNVMDATVTTPYTLKSTHLIKSKSRFEGTAAPAAGTWARGDEVRNSAPTVGAAKSWLCTVAGTPGTWVSTGNL